MSLIISAHVSMFRVFLLKMTTTIFYNEEELSALQASSLIPFTKQRLSAVERHYRNLVKEFSQILQRGGIGKRRESNKR